MKLMKIFLVLMLIFAFMLLVVEQGKANTPLTIKRYYSSLIYVYTAVITNLASTTNIHIMHPKDVYNSRIVQVWNAPAGAVYTNLGGGAVGLLGQTSGNLSGITLASNIVVKYTRQGETQISNAGSTATRVKINIIIFR